ncbi:tetratricopeptide repeat protein, partial [Myxococcota bacterium]
MTDIQTHLETLAHQPGDTTALEAVEAVYSAEGRWEELLRIYEDNALRAERPLVPALLRKAARLCMDELSSTPRAEAYLSRAIEVEPSDIESLAALRRLYLDRGEYERGVDVYEKELARTADIQARAKGLVEVAEIFRQRLRRHDKALGALRQAQRADKAFAPIYQSMAAIYDMQGRLDQAQVALLTELEIGGATEEVLARLTALAQRLLDRPKLHDLAGSSAEAVLAHRPNDGTATAIKAELEQYGQDWSGKVSQLIERATQAQSTDKEEAADLWLTVAELQLVYGEDPDAALLSLDKAVAQKPGHAGALRVLEELYGAQERHEDLALKLEMMAAYAREPEVAIDLYLKAAMHYAVRLDNPEASASVHQRVLQLDPGNKVSSNALAEFYRDRQQWDEALTVLAQWAERATQASDKVAAHYSCCRILEEEVGDKARARPHYEAILELDPENQAAALALEAVYREAEDHEA